MIITEEKKEIQERLNKLFEKHVPNVGHSKTREGEAVRAISRIIYRWHNDGDYWWNGYGTETCGAAAGYLMNYDCPVKNSIRDSSFFRNDTYELHIYKTAKEICDHVENTKVFNEKSVDMFDYKSPYESDEYDGYEEYDV